MIIGTGVIANATINNTPIETAYLKGIEWKYNNADFATKQIQVYTVVPDTNPANSQVAGNTGLSYNPLTHQLVVAFYNYAYYSALYVYDRKDLIVKTPTPPIIPTPTKLIDITSKIDHLQGVAYNKNDGLYYAWGTRKGAAESDANRIVVMLDGNGNRGKPDYTPNFSAQAGMIAIFRNSLYFKPNAALWFREIDLETRNFVRQVLTYTVNEGFAFDIHGNIYIGGDDGSLRKYDFDMNELAQFTTGVTGGEVEGVAIDPCDDTVWINADTYLHGGNLNGNSLWHLDLNKTYKKFVRFPEMISWDKGYVSGLTIFNNSLIGVGVWESPILDFESYADFLSNMPTELLNNVHVAYEYRSSNLEPDTTKTDNVPVTYYNGWGSVTPSSYSSSPITNRYQQIKITISI